MIDSRFPLRRLLETIARHAAVHGRLRAAETLRRCGGGWDVAVAGVASIDLLGLAGELDQVERLGLGAGTAELVLEGRFGGEPVRVRFSREAGEVGDER